jgi:hypothetical protein
MTKVANRNVWDFGWEIAHGAFRDARRFPSTRWYPCSGGYTYAAKVWDLSIIQGPFSVAPCQPLALRFRNSLLSSVYHLAVLLLQHGL